MTDNPSCTAPATKYLRDQIKPLKINQRTHYALCERYQRRNFLLGLAIVALSTFVGAFSFADLTKFPDWLPTALSACSLLAALFAAIATFAGFANWAAKSQSSAIGYGRLLREARSRTCGCISEADNVAYLPKFKSEWDDISARAPVTFIRSRVAAKNRTEEMGG